MSRRGAAELLAPKCRAVEMPNCSFYCLLVLVAALVCGIRAAVDGAPIQSLVGVAFAGAPLLGWLATVLLRVPRLLAGQG